MFQVLSFSETLFVTGICFVTLAPRQPTDHVGVCTVGGYLTKPFRRIHLGLAMMNAFRTFFFSDQRFHGSDDEDGNTTEEGGRNFATSAYFGMTAAESFGVNFLCLLTPYLLQWQMTGRINIRPGKNLMPWVYLILVLNILGMILTSFYDSPRLWSIKRLGDAMSGIPVMKTLFLFDSVSSVNTMDNAGQGQRAGRGFVMSQTLMAMERVNFVFTLLAALGYTISSNSLNKVATASDLATSEVLSASFRIAGIYSNWARIMIHGLLLNTIDEMSHFRTTDAFSSPRATSTGSGDVFDDNVSGMEENRLTARFI